MTPAAFSTDYLAKDPAPSGGLRDVDSIEGRKVDQAAADYRDHDVRCSACTYFDGVDSCSKVDGKISPDGNSKYFVRDESNTEDRNDNDSAEANLGIED